MKNILSAAVMVLAMHNAFAVDIYQVTPNEFSGRTYRGETGAQLYGGVTYGASYVDFNCTFLTDCKYEDTGFKLYGGFNITANIATELGYVGFGKGAAEFDDSGLVNKIKVEATALVLNGAFRFDMTPNFAGVVRLGIANVKTKVRRSNIGERESFSETKIAPYMGLGLEYTVAESLKGVAAIDFTKTEFYDEKSDVRLISLGLQYGF